MIIKNYQLACDDIKKQQQLVLPFILPTPGLVTITKTNSMTCDDIKKTTTTCPPIQPTNSSACDDHQKQLIGL